jgi:hypothetical protein
MDAGQTVFSQLMDHLPSYEFQKCVERYRGDAHYRGFSCRDQYLAMAFAQVELFFKWIKQHLRIKAFYGTSENAVKTQIWIAVSTYVLVAIVRKRLSLEASLYQILQILSLTLFEKTPILRALQTSDYDNDLDDIDNQLILFDL